MILDVFIFSLFCLSGIISFMVLQKDRTSQIGKDDTIRHKLELIRSMQKH